VIGLDSHSKMGHVYFPHPNGLVDIQATMEKTGLRFVLIGAIAAISIQLVANGKLSRRLLWYFVLLFSLPCLRLLVLITCMYLSDEPFDVNIENWFLSEQATLIFAFTIGWICGAMREPRHLPVQDSEKPFSRRSHFDDRLT